jgi:hypothetical protein
MESNFRIEIEKQIKDMIDESQIVVKPNTFNTFVIPKKPGLLERLNLKKVMGYKPPPKPFKFR